MKVFYRLGVIQINILIYFFGVGVRTFNLASKLLCFSLLLWLIVY